ncbi:MAG: DNA recombination protein RmuC [Bacteroidia bacterium]|nr:DNA recombination protein RmuC [Bacteroidia bacterium]MBP7262139.1 DNA recombination protein RmuC [Bacteroidia bacterium]MBP9181384.1 DNA recombination protein RmuC [Bacteroidia bacterium]
MTDVIFLIIGLIVGAIAGFFMAGSKKSAAGSNDEQLQQLQMNTSRLEEQNRYLTQQIGQREAELNEEREKKMTISTQLAEVKANHDNVQQRLTEQKNELQQLQEKFTKEFENLANKILEEKSQKFTEQNKINIDQILKPLGEKIKDFEKKVQDNYDAENKEKASLKTEIQRLYELNQKMTTDAQNLTRALKGDNKAQGNWGEFILETILEKSGLNKDREYSIQPSFTTEDGRRLQPDVIINLPEGKSLIIDSKVSLTGYEKYYTAEDDTERQVALREHLLSVRTHIKGLSEKKYQNLYQLKSLDFVLLFIPIEPAFALSVQQDAQLFHDAFEKNIVIVSPSTLLATLRTVSSIWRQENHNRNAVEIARKAGDLYDKFDGFVKDMIGLGTKLDQSKKDYESAMNKLSTGKGNIVKRVQELKDMGAIASKSLPQNLLDRAGEE